MSWLGFKSKNIITLKRFGDHWFDHATTELGR